MSKIIKVSAVCAVVIGILLSVASVVGIRFTYMSIARENIVTTPDSTLPNMPVRGPLTL